MVSGAKAAKEFDFRKLRIWCKCPACKRGNLMLQAFPSIFGVGFIESTSVGNKPIETIRTEQEATYICDNCGRKVEIRYVNGICTITEKEGFKGLSKAIKENDLVLPNSK